MTTRGEGDAERGRSCFDWKNIIHPVSLSPSLLQSLISGFNPNPLEVRTLEN